MMSLLHQASQLQPLQRDKWRVCQCRSASALVPNAGSWDITLPIVPRVECPSVSQAVSSCHACSGVLILALDARQSRCQLCALNLSHGKKNKCS
jgi:hypothetical protein